MRKTLRSGIFLVIFLLFSPVYAQEQEQDEKPKETREQTPDDVVTGEIHITLNSEFPKLLVNGEDFEDHEFDSKGTELILHKISRTIENKILLTHASDTLDQMQIVVKPSEWKLVNIDKNLKMWLVKKTVKFLKKPPKKEDKEEVKTGEDVKKEETKKEEPKKEEKKKGEKKK
jgi:hypothetical protein